MEGVMADCGVGVKVRYAIWKVRYGLASYLQSHSAEEPFGKKKSGSLHDEHMLQLHQQQQGSCKSVVELTQPTHIGSSARPGTHASVKPQTHGIAAESGKHQPSCSVGI